MISYEAILNKSKDFKEARKLLYIVVGAERPLTLKEMNIALNISKCYDGSHTFKIIELEDPVTFADKIRNICGLFLHVSDSRVCLMHQTAKELLVRKSTISTSDWKRSLYPSISQAIIAEACISYLYLGNLAVHTREPLHPRIRDKSMLALQETDFLEYSSQYWI